MAAENLSADELRRALDEQQHALIGPMLLWLCAIYGALLVANPLTTPGFPAHWPAIPRLLTGVQATVLATFGAMAVMWRLRPLPVRWSAPLTFVLLSLPLLDAWLHVWLRRDPFESLSYVLVVLGAAMLFNQRRWFLAFVALAVAGWVAMAPTVYDAEVFKALAFVVGQGTLLAVAIFVLRLRTLTRLERLRWLAEQRGRQLDVQNRQLLQLDRLKTEFVNAVSHDLRTPLTGIKGFSEFLEDELGGPLTELQKGYVAQIVRGTQRLEYLVDDLLDFARVEAGTFSLRREPDDLGLRVTDLAAGLAPLFVDNDVRLSVSVPPEPAMARIDARRIDQVLSNLLSNAAKFTRAGGRVAVRLERADGAWRVEVEDDGPGIAPEDLPKLFGRFVQLHAGREKGGTGLGLSISKAIVEAHGGRIGIESEPGAGATFWFTVPACPLGVEPAPYEA